MSLIYKVVKKETGSVQPGPESATFWTSESLYCGPDKTDARICYHEHKSEEYGGGYGNAARLIQLIEIDDEDAETDITPK